MPEGEGPPPDDRFSDLGAEEAARRRRKAIGDALAERDKVAPEPDSRRPEVPRPGNKYAWVVGIVMLMGIGVLLLTTTLPDRGEGVSGPDPGTMLPDFATPLATSDLEGDANLCQSRPCPESLGPIPACEVRTDEVLNSCELRRKPVVLTFIVDRGGDCKPQVDRVERMRSEFPQVNFATVFFSRDDRDELREIVERRGWEQAVGIDRDGQITNRYLIGVCPTTVFARAGGRVRESALGNLTEDQLRRKTRGLLRG